MQLSLGGEKDYVSVLYGIIKGGRALPIVRQRKTRGKERMRDTRREIRYRETGGSDPTIDSGRWQSIPPFKGTQA